MSALVQALLAELDDQALDDLAERLRPRLTPPIGGVTGEPWLSVQSAADHLACPRSRIYALVSAGRIPVHRDGTRLLFNRTELDAWVRAGGATRP